ncbi:MAG TPA: HRDC domain-containing protein, partial [Myxococcota bacterium]|nr:HRDC domain-containing protein [Myxococcota bacterium]
ARVGNELLPGDSMSFTEARILTIQWDTRTGMFDDSVLRNYLVNRELVRCVPQFFEHKGLPCWSLYIETNVIQGVVASDLSAPERQAASAAVAAQMSEFDEIQKIRYERIVAWRAEAAMREGLKSYMICTNRDAMELARTAPATLAALGRVHGFGEKKLAKYGREILEILHGTYGTSGSVGGIRKVDADDKGLPAVVGVVSQEVPVVADGQDGKPVP